MSEITSQSSSDDAPPLGHEPPIPPRPLTRSARRGAWVESSVRFWGLLFLLVLGLSLYIAASRWYVWQKELDLFTSGLRVEAEVIHWQKDLRPQDEMIEWVAHPPRRKPGIAYMEGVHQRKLDYDGQLLQLNGDEWVPIPHRIEPLERRPDSRPAQAGSDRVRRRHPAMIDNPNAGVRIRFIFNGQMHDEFGRLEGRKGTISLGEWIYIRVDPNNPRRWTARSEPKTLQSHLLMVFALIPGALILLLFTLWRRGRVLRIYRNGQILTGHVTDVRHSAVAPLSRLIHCTVEDGDQACVVKATIPSRVAPRPGDRLWMIAPPGKPHHAIPAALFE